VTAKRAQAPDLGPVLPWPSEPMLCRSIEHLPPARDLPASMSFEAKFDGFRGLAGIDASGQVQLRSRRGTDLTSAFPEIAAAVADQVPPNTLLDGELVVWHKDRLDFSQLQRRIASRARVASLVRTHPASYIVFDLLQYQGRNMIGEPQRVRRRLLESILHTLSPPLQIIPSTRDRAVAEQWFTDYAAADIGVEGLVLKNSSGIYRPGKRSWMKLRSRSSAEAVVGAVNGTLTAPERLILGQPDPDGRLLVAGSTTPLSPAQRLEIAAYLRPFTGAHPWPPNVPPHSAGQWNNHRRLPVTRVQPTLVVEIEIDSGYQYGRIRHLARLRRVRPDLTPSEVMPPQSSS